ncbi:ATP-binding protein [Candidatus Woesearchaeota archaeon]|nr:ATP-binding protein [Candidatus Woesearchaeota archaeon]
MIQLETLVDRISHRFSMSVSAKPVPEAFSLAMSEVTAELTEKTMPIDGHLRKGLFDRLFRTRYDALPYEITEQDGTIHEYMVAGTVEQNGENVAVGVGIKLRQPYYQILVYADSRKAIDAVLTLLGRHVVENNPVRGKVIDLHGNIKHLDGMDWDRVAVPPRFRAEFEQNIIFPVQNYTALKGKGLYTPRGVLMAGEVGMGKSLIGRVIARKVADAGGTVIMTAPHEIAEMGGWKYVFEVAGTLRPTLLYFEDVETSGKTENPYMYQLAEYLDGLEDRRDVIMLVTTNELSSVDRRLRDRPGRLDRVLNFDPKEPEFGPAWKKEVLSIHLNGQANLQADPAQIAAVVGARPFSGAHLAELVTTARALTVQNGGLEKLSAAGGSIILDASAITAAMQAVVQSYPCLRKEDFGFRPYTKNP